MKKIITLLMSFAITYSYAQDCGGRYQNEVFDSVIVSTVDFGAAVNLSGDNQTLKMDIYTPYDDTATNRPVAIFCFGGSFIGGSRTSGELVYMATSLAKRGYVAASIDYRLASGIGDLTSEEKMVKVVFAAVQDGKAAIRYFRQNADNGNSLGVDSNQIFIGGTSAGGILAINLAYMDSVTKLSASWSNWLEEIGGLEGESGNQGYCSYPQGVFAFAGGVADTSYLNANDIPFYGCHSVDDNTVQYGFGAPLNGFAPVSLYGSSNLEARMNSLGIYNELETYQGSAHPPFASDSTILYNTNNSLAAFLYNIVDCNPSNMKHSDQQNCTDFKSASVVCIDCDGALKNEQLILYPNPTKTSINIESNAKMEQIVILNILGKEVYNKKLEGKMKYEIRINNFPSGSYFMKIGVEDKWVTKVLQVIE